MAAHGVSGFDGTHTFRGAAENQIAGLQFPRRRQVFDGFSHAPDELGDVAALAVSTVDLQADFGMVDVGGLVNRCDGTDGARVVERFANAPGTALFFHQIEKK